MADRSVEQGVVGVVAEGPSVGVDPRWWQELGMVVVSEADFPGAVVNEPVVVTAE